MMRILLCIRNDYLINYAGDSRLLLEIADYLRKNGAFVTIDSGGISDYRDYDIIHLFNLTRITETYRCFKIARRFKKVIVITPVYWDLQKYYRFIHDAQSLSLWNYYRTFRREIIGGCAMVYPAGYSEKNLLEKDYGNEFPYCIIRCGATAPEKILGVSDELMAIKPYLFCAARICRRKNQLKLCETADRIGMNLILAGEINDKSYFDRCLAYSNVHYWGALNETALGPLYRNAALHVLCSFVETPGLASLEAGIHGTDIVSTGEGSAREYFGDLSHYCNPYEEDDMKETILSALSDSRQPVLKQHIENHFLWPDCLSALLESYKNLLG